MLSDRLRQVEEHLELSQIHQFETEYWQILAAQPAETALAVKSAVEFRFLLTVLKTGELTIKNPEIMKILIVFPLNKEMAFRIE